MKTVKLLKGKPVYLVFEKENANIYIDSFNSCGNTIYEVCDKDGVLLKIVVQAGKVQKVEESSRAKEIFLLRESASSPPHS